MTDFQKLVMQMNNPWRIGTKVREPEGRHIGKVAGYLNGIVKVRWANGWISWLYPYEIERA